MNIRSFYKNFCDLETLLETFYSKPDIIVISETWLTDEKLRGAYIDGYEGVHSIRCGGRSGGISIFYKIGLNVSKCDLFCLNNDTIEMCTIKIISSDTILFLIGIYRPHSGTIENFTNCLETILNDGILLNSKICII